jgi:hypothetical protein
LAYGCNVNVCIRVSGSGLRVTGIETTAYYSGPTKCTYPRVTLNSQQNVIFTWTWVWGSSGVFVGDVVSGLPRNFHNNDKICANWYVLSGYPCEFIEG